MTYRDPIELINPVQLIWLVQSPLGQGEIKIDIDLRLPGMTSTAIKRFMEVIWSNVWAPLISTAAKCVIYSSTPLVFGSPGFQFGSLTQTGMVLEPPSMLRDSLLIIAYGGNPRADSNRRITVPFIPASWSDQRVLTDTAYQVILTSLRAFMLGADGDRGGIGPRLILFHLPRAADRWNVARPAQFEDVQQLLACSYVDRAPSV